VVKLVRFSTAWLLASRIDVSRAVLKGEEALEGTSLALFMIIAMIRVKEQEEGCEEGCEGDILLATPCLLYYRIP
jgi:hypothetical protein